VKDVERYKRFVSTTVTTLMVISMVFCWIVCLYHWVYLQTGYFYICRYRSDFLQEVDFEL